MNKFITGLAVIVGLTGCSDYWKDRDVSIISNSTICLNGVTYYKSTNVLAPVFNKNTKQVELCNE